jgi:hypothetical protein
MLKSFGMRRNFYFWKTLLLLQRSALVHPPLVIESVEDEALYQEIARISLSYEGRIGVIGEFLKRDSLFEPNDEDVARAAYAKADKQYDLELAEEGVNLKRDQKFIENMLALWDRAGPEKAAVLYAGSSHQYRIARQLPPGISYYHIEQP